MKKEIHSSSPETPPGKFIHIILFEFLLLFLATTFYSDNPPGWFQQQLPVNRLVSDIFFIDSQSGWVVTTPGNVTSDTGFIMKTTNGGNNWMIQFRDRICFNSVQFLDLNTGFAVGGNGPAKLFRTSDGGINWINVATAMNGLGSLEDMFFINKDTGWVCDENAFGGLSKTTNAGGNWTLQLDDTYNPRKLFFLNKDTGWVVSDLRNLFRTTNGGTNWNLQYTFSGNLGTCLFFINKDTGFVSGGGGSSALKRTTDGGFNWSPPNTTNGGNVFMINNSFGWYGQGFNEIGKTTDGGMNWYIQNSPIFNNGSIMFIDTLTGWAGGSGLVHTTDGGGPFSLVEPIGKEIPSEFRLLQNYPNPFNSYTIINYELPAYRSFGAGRRITSYVEVRIFDIAGREVAILAGQKQPAGIYRIDFDAGSLSSGVYFYSMFIDGKLIDSRKMVLLK